MRTAGGGETGELQDVQESGEADVRISRQTDAEDDRET